MSNVLEVVGLLALVVAGFLVALWLGFAVLGGSCLWVAGVAAREKRLATEAAERRRVARLA
jgi:hypothetical protein